MKVKCIRLIDGLGRDIEYSSWLKIGHVYHVLSMQIDPDGRRSFGIVAHEQQGEWPILVIHDEKCFEVVSEVIPSNWRVWMYAGVIGVSPAAWQAPSFYESFFNHDESVYPIFERERNIIVSEDV